MFVCLCNGVTSQVVAECVEAGARTCNQVAQACGAGAECGRCRRTVRAIIDTADGAQAKRHKGFMHKE